MQPRILLLLSLWERSAHPDRRFCAVRAQAPRRVRGYGPSIDRNPSPRPSPRGRGSRPLLARRHRTEVSLMPQTIHRGIKALIDEANAQIETLSAADAIEAAKSDDVVIVDIRDPREIERDGRIPGAFSCTRGMLEFWIDP